MIAVGNWGSTCWGPAEILCGMYLKILPLDGGALGHLSTDFYTSSVVGCTWGHLCLQEVNEFKDR